MMSRGTLTLNNRSSVLRVYYDHDTPLTLLPTGEYAVTQAVDIPRPFLEPPAPEKEFLLSPPGSPPVGWEQQKEDRPNTQALSDDLIKALQKLSMEQEVPEAEKAGTSTLFQGSDQAVPGVILHATESRTSSSSRPSGIERVKATKDSMRPTPRPPI